MGEQFNKSIQYFICIFAIHKSSETMAGIINFSEAASIAIHSLVIIARSEEPVNAIKISEKLKSSRHHIAKVMQRLVKEGYLNSYRGPSGGFTMKKDPSSIRIYDIYRLIEGDMDHFHCPEDNLICPPDKCIRNKIIKKLSEDFNAFLKQHYLSDLV